MKKILSVVLLACMMVLVTKAYAQDVLSEADNSTAVNYEDFSTGLRFGTWALNAFVLPGLGSLILMKDKVGGTVQLVTYGVEVVTLLGGYFVFLDAMMNPSYTTNTYGDKIAHIDARKINTGITIMIVAAGIELGNLIFNTIRVATYHKPQPKIASIIDPAAWNLAVIPSNEGIEKVSLSYTMRF